MRMRVRQPVKRGLLLLLAWGGALGAVGCSDNDAMGPGADAGDVDAAAADGAEDSGAVVVPDGGEPDATVDAGEQAPDGGPMPDAGDEPAFDPDVVFTGTVDDSSRRLYAIDLDQPGVLRELSGDLGSGTVESFMMDPTGRSVAFGANALDPEKVELFWVDLEDLAAPRVRLNDDLGPGRDVRSAGKRRGTGAGYRFSPDGEAVFYVTTKDVTAGLYRVPVATPGSGQSVRVSEAGGVGRFGFSESGSSLLYLANTDGNSSQLFEVDLTPGAPGNAVQINDTLVEQGEVDDGQFSGDGMSIVYEASQDFPTVTKLWAVRRPDVGPGNSFQLSDSSVQLGRVQNFRTVFGTSEVVYAQATAARTLELFRVDISDPGSAVRLNGPLVDGGSVRDTSGYGITPDGSRVVYVADEEVDDRLELYTVDITDPTQRRKLSDPARGDWIEDLVRSSPDGRSVAFIQRDNAVPSSDRLMLVDLAAGSAVEVSHALGARARINDFEFTPDGTKLVYQVNQGPDPTRTLYAVDIATPGVETLLHPPLRDGGRIFEFQMVP